ncbi:heat-inducible transcriptional repressor HrcA [Phocicoccus pinnipedialis]|uniref:Heat-inducible transcription repressor HrcA n=1 Tax=Phocicoccus pinnipedialis TaxID=110845 RepID=A0A6V7REP7_9BACL|nr:heat-inducible transcriptional repressor HrcA [Jeotgalicoccus pinnipedialis]MBP1939253.1 heat-inducible transcriptional repressor [Jeotgalicoccus pinnipedialis]CAD2076132.1 Heat-inducible transcription repressor HrcA [Jeotgalicoccus pinnipedialis]
MLTERQKSILYFIVDDFLDDGTPVSSQHLIDKYNMNISSATVRNEMAVLEKEGYITKAHTSSGRIPSRNGLKHYIKNISMKYDSKKSLKFEIDASLSDIEVLGQTIAHSFSEETQHLTYVTLTDGRAIIKGVYLTPISENLVLIILVMDSESVRKFTVEKEAHISDKEMEKVGVVLNNLLRERPVVDVMDILKYYHYLDDFRIKQFVTKLVHKIEQNISENNKIVAYSGLQFLLKDFQSEIETLETLYEDIEHARLPVVKTDDNPISVLFGHELREDYQTLSIITTDINQNGFEGQLMIIGPEMMRYKNVIKAVNAFRK